MIMTEFAMMDPGPTGSSILAKCYRTLAHFFGFGDPVAPQGMPEILPTRDALPIHESASPVLKIVEPDVEPETRTPHRWRRHEQLLDRPTSSLPDQERQARHHAVRGLFAAQAGDLNAAEHHFTLAAACDEIDLGDIPGFWNLDRAAMSSAVHAYEVAGRLRDASALNATMRRRLRPRAIPPAPGNVTKLPVRRLSLSSNS